MKKEKKRKTELDYLKSINCSLSLVLLAFGCLIIIAIIVNAGTFSTDKIEAKAAAENLLDGPVEITIEDNYTGSKTVEMDLNITVGNTYTILYSIDDGERLTISNTCFDENAENNGYTSIGTMGENATKINNEYALYIGKDFKIDDEDWICEEGYVTFVVIHIDEEQSNTNVLVTVWGIYEGTEAGEPNYVNARNIIGNITGSFTTFLTGTGDGIVNFVETIFTNGNGGISILGIVALSMMGLGLATGTIKYLLNKV